MDANAKKKALFRSKLNAQKREKRIESPLVRYNELDQPVCRVCEVVLKSESLWPAHQASRKHHEAIDQLKASARAAPLPKALQPGPREEISKPRSEIPEEMHNRKSEPSKVVGERHPSSGLPTDFFDTPDAKRQKSENIDRYTSDSIPESSSNSLPAKEENGQLSESTVGAESKQAKGALPEGFFDNKDADLRARGITPVKPDVKDEYKEFEKLIQEDLQVIDERMEEEEFDAAEMIEEAETVEQRTYRERVEMLRKKKMERKATKAAVSGKSTEVVSKQLPQDESSSDDDSDETVDWRAKHL